MNLDNDEKINDFDEEKFIRMVGRNARKAREINNLSQSEAQYRIFNYKNPNLRANRISEIENGQKRLDAKILYKMALTYGCSVDYLLGISSDFEINHASSFNGAVHQSIRGVLCEIGDQISENVSKLLKFMPSYQGELLNSSAKKVVDEIKNCKHDLVFVSNHPKLIELSAMLESSVRTFDTYTARQSRLIETAMLDQIDSISEKQIDSMAIDEK